MDQKSPEAFRTISEVAEWLGVPTHVLRFWESRFSQVKPVKRAGGRRYYRPADMELLGGIRKLLHEDGMTIRGVQKLLREKGVRHVAEMSPALDLAADTRDVTPDNVVDLSDRREAGTEPKPAEPEADQGDAPWYDSGIFAEAPGATPEAETGQAAPSEPAADAPDPTAAPPSGEGESADREPAAPPTDAEPTEPLAEDAGANMFRAPPAAQEPEAEPEGARTKDAHEAAASTEESDPADPVSSPDALEFAAHEAEPDTHEPEAEPEGARAQDAHEVAASAEEPDPADPMSSPEALEFAAHEAEPDTHEPAEPAAPETTPQGTQAAPDASPEPTPEAAALPAAPRPALVMPAIGPDPDDDAFAPDAPLIAARLRAARASRAGLAVANLRALSDRLDEIAQRMREDGTGSSGI